MAQCGPTARESNQHDLLNDSERLERSIGGSSSWLRHDGGAEMRLLAAVLCAMAMAKGQNSSCGPVRVTYDHAGFGNAFDVLFVSISLGATLQQPRRDRRG